jgi:hypothetical protein
MIEQPPIRNLDCSVEYHVSDAPSTGSVLFICQSGRLEVQACLLALTLREHLTSDFRLIAAIPEALQAMKPINAFTLDLLRDLGVEIARFGNPLVDPTSNKVPKERILLANKIAAIRDVSWSGEKCIFLDSDQLCLGNFTRDVSLVAPVTVRTVGWVGAKYTHYSLPAIYKHAGVQIPSERVMICDPKNRSHALFVPLDANTSFIGMDANLAPSIGRRWMELFIALEVTPGLLAENGKRFQEQVTFVPSVRSLELPIVFVPEPSQPFVHYHRTEWILRCPVSNQCVARQLKRYPVLLQVAAGLPDWMHLFDQIQLNP